MVTVDLIAALVLGILTIVLTVLGSLSVESFRYRFAFCVMGGFCIVCTVWIVIRNHQSQERVEKNLGEILRLQDISTNLQKQLIESSAATARLNQQSVEEITGGDSFCYLDVLVLGGSETYHLGIFGKGKNPVSGVFIRIVDLDVFHQLVRAGESTRENLAKTERTFSFPLPTRYTGHFTSLYPFTAAPEVMSKRFNIFISARNGDFTELLRLRRAERGWKIAKRVLASFYDQRKGIVLEEISSGFPMEDLRSDTDWKETEKLPRLKVRE